jgi:hypothetical protein
MRYMFRPHRAIFRQHIIKESTALCTLSIVLLRYVININFGIIRCSSCLLYWDPFGCAAQSGHNTKYRKNKHPIIPKLIIMTYLESTIDKVHNAVDYLQNELPEDGRVWPKPVAHKHRMYIYIYIF